VNDVPLPPLAVDMDGTVVLGDTLHESLLVLLRRNPLYLFALPAWLLGGKARFKREIARRALPAPADLAYNRPLLDWLRDQRGRRELILCTAADAGIAHAVAGHLDLFDTVLASDGERNLDGERKAALLVERHGEQGFDYAGNGAVDVAIWRHARRAIVVNASAGTERAARAAATVEHVLPAAPAGPRAWLRALRLHQWIKNLLVFVPLLTAHLALDPQSVLHSTLAFTAFGLCASSVYLLNDLLDLPSDRAHPRKRNRPFAAGQLSLLAGLALAPLLLAAAFALAALALPGRFVLALAGYYLLTLAYSLALKRVEMLDVVVLAALYTARIVAGTFALAIALSFWLLAFSMFLFLSLALVKRYTELAVMREQGLTQAAGRGYRTDDLPMLGALGAAAGYLSVLVLALYINSANSHTLYGQPKALWLLCPLLLYWISRVWLLTQRGRMHDDPLLFALRDPVSLAVLALGLATVLVAV
jgi:4-hydroxybenzoate polyprenyltransferase